MRIDIAFDTICPWCFIGKRRLERALAQRPFVRPRVTWRPFLLNPEMAQSGMDRQLYLERKFGSPLRVQRVLQTIRDSARPDGLDFDFDAMRRTPNSTASHVLVRKAQDGGCADKVVEALFQAYFCHGQDIGDTELLVQIGQASGLDPASLREALGADAEHQAVHSENLRLHRLGVSGVPCFIFADRYAVAGAQDADVLVRMLDLAVEGAASALPSLVSEPA